MVSTMHSIQKDLDSRIDAIGWGAFFVMSGAMLLAPGLPDGTWLAGVGILLLALGAARLALGLPVSTFGAIIATVLVASGAGTMAGVVVPWFSMLLILCGLALVVGDIIVRRPARA